MPPKTTWFEPKLRSGLVVHSLEEPGMSNSYIQRTTTAGRIFTSFRMESRSEGSISSFVSALFSFHFSLFSFSSSLFVGTIHLNCWHPKQNALQPILFSSS